MHAIELSLIVAMTPERVIGYQGGLPWGRIPSDLTHFKRITTEIGIIIMGRKTWESIPEKNRPLHGRRHIVITRGPIPSSAPDLVHFVNSTEDACAVAALHGKRACVVGGEEIYKLFLSIPALKKAHVTTVHAQLPGDTFFPEMGPEWKCVGMTETHRQDPKDAYETSFRFLERL